MRPNNRRMVRIAYDWAIAAVYFVVLPFLAISHVALRLGPKSRKLVWGPVPIINNKYWSAAMREAGWESTTLMESYYSSINRRGDYDVYFDDLVKGIRPAALATAIRPLAAHLYITRNAAVMHMPFSGGPLGATPIWRMEAALYRLAGVKTVVLPYGADVFLYSRITDPAVRHALQLSYPGAARTEEGIEARVRYWTRHADIIVLGYTLDGIGRWDVAPMNFVAIDVKLWRPKISYSQADGKTAAVRVLHAPNHRGAKGTEFLVSAVEQLRSRGLAIELWLVEGRQNEEVRSMMQEADILADQFLLPGYGMAAIEGMASGLPVMVALGSEEYTRTFRRWSILDECPLLATSPESLCGNLEALVSRPQLRRQLGEAGRAYIEKYHSFEATQHLFGSIYRQILRGEAVDLMNLFHPLKSDYVRTRAKVSHPLVENRLPVDAP